MTANGIEFQHRPLRINGNIPSTLGSQLMVLRDLALSLVRDLEDLREYASVESNDGICLNTVVRRYEIALIQQALQLTKGHQVRASHLLGLKPTTLNAKIKRYEIPFHPTLSDKE